MNRLRLISLFFGLMVSVLPVAGQDKIAANQRDIDKYTKDVRLLEEKIRVLDKEKGSAAKKLELIKAAVDARKSLVAESDREIARYNGSIGQKNKKIKALSLRLDTLTAYYTRLVRNAYKNRDPKVWYMYILASDNLGQAFRRIGFLKSLSSQMGVQAAKIKETKASLDEEKKALVGLRSQAEALRTQRRAELTAISKEQKEAEKLLAQINRNAKKYKREAEQKKAEITRLNKELDKLKRQLAGGSSGNGKTSSGKIEIDQALAAEFKNNQGKLPWPLDGPVIGKFGSHSHPLHRNVKTLKNNGINVAAAEDSSVRAVFDGTVLQVFEIKGYGQCVALLHGNYMTQYCRLKEIKVKKGDKVKTGQVLGKLATIGGDSYLHFELWNTSGTPVNPEIWLK